MAIIQAWLALAAAAAVAAPQAPLKLELTVATERRGALTFLQAKVTATNTGQADVWINSRQSARLWPGTGVPWVFEVNREDGAPQQRTVHWLCRINDRPSRPMPYVRLAPGHSVEVKLLTPCARLVEPGRYVVKVKFQDRQDDPAFQPEGPAVMGPLESAAKTVDVGP